VLIVDEDAQAAERAFASLSQLGYEVLVSSSAREALNFLARRSYDCILVDIGRESVARPVIEELRRYPPETVGLIVTGTGGQVSAIEALREGALDYIRKPVDPAILKASVARATERASIVRTMRELVEDFDSTNSRLRAFAGELQHRVDHVTAQLRQKLAELDDANRELAEERRRREEFIAMVAHDLAGPLTMVSTYVQLLARPAVSPQVQDRARGVIMSESRRMVRLLRDLTDAVPLTSGRFRVQPVRCDLTEIVREQVDLAQMRDDRHRIQLEMPPASLITMCDPDRFAQVLTNLLGNAMKYSPRGTITVRLWAEANEVRLQVRDKGRGIPPNLLRSIFEPGVRAHKGTDDGDPAPNGAGLGLYIVRGIVEALGGRIWAESDGVNGATFALAVPLVEPAAQQ
jgi:signal transduction histidine kinase